MNRIVLSARDKVAVRETFLSWNVEDLARTKLDAVARRNGVAGVDAYITLLHIDTLAAIAERPPLVWKGGTAIQTYLEPGFQRISVDLDFNATTANVTALRDFFAERNAELEEKGHVVWIGEVPFGAFVESFHRPEYKTMEFRRILPTPYNETVVWPFGAQKGDRRIQGRVIRVQVNYAHTELPAMWPTSRSPRFFTQPDLLPRHTTEVTMGSPDDLLADKILATTRHFGFGRERFKDVYDILALHRSAQAEPSRSQEKLDRILGQDDRITVVEGSLETLEVFSDEGASAFGFRNAVCDDGKGLVDRWHDAIHETIEWLLPLAKPRT